MERKSNKKLIWGIILCALAILCLVLCIVALNDHSNNLAPGAAGLFGCLAFIGVFYGVWLIVKWVKNK